MVPLLLPSGKGEGPFLLDGRRNEMQIARTTGRSCNTRDLMSVHVCLTRKLAEAYRLPDTSFSNPGSRHTLKGNLLSVYPELFGAYAAGRGEDSDFFPIFGRGIAGKIVGGVGGAGVAAINPIFAGAIPGGMVVGSLAGTGSYIKKHNSQKGIKKGDPKPRKDNPAVAAALSPFLAGGMYHGARRSSTGSGVAHTLAGILGGVASGVGAAMLANNQGLSDTGSWVAGLGGYVAGSAASGGVYSAIANKFLPDNRKTANLFDRDPKKENKPRKSALWTEIATGVASGLGAAGGGIVGGLVGGGRRAFGEAENLHAEAQRYERGATAKLDEAMNKGRSLNIPGHQDSMAEFWDGQREFEEKLPGMVAESAKKVRRSTAVGAGVGALAGAGVAGGATYLLGRAIRRRREENERKRLAMGLP